MAQPWILLRRREYAAGGGSGGDGEKEREAFSGTTPMITIHMSNSDAANARVTVSVTTVSHTRLRPISGFLHLYSFSIIFFVISSAFVLKRRVRNNRDSMIHPHELKLR